jgi:hypothetical protein
MAYRIAGIDIPKKKPAVVVTHNYLSQESGLLTSPTRQCPPPQRLRSDGLLLHNPVR